MKILVAIDGSRAADAALQFAVELARSCRGAKLVVLTVSELRQDLRLLMPSNVRAFVPYRDLEKTEKVALQRRLADAVKGVHGRDRGRPLRVRTRLLDPRKPSPIADAILREADREGADMIVVGSEGRGGITGWALGSVAQRLVSLSRRPVAVVHAPRRARRAGRAAA